jgi:hypothetical protein
MRRLALGLLPALALAGCGSVTVVSMHHDSLPPCPASDMHPPISQRPGADRTLVPTGARAVLICRYRDPRHLIAHRLITNPATVRALVAAFNGLPPIHPGVEACPVDTGNAVVAHFEYATKPDDPVHVNRTGCRSVTNGHLVRWTTAHLMQLLT